MLDKHIATGTFDEEIIPIGRHTRTRCWTSIQLVLLTRKLYQLVVQWNLLILTVDSTLVDMERNHPLRCWIGVGDRRYACLHHILSVGALELRQGSEGPNEERLRAHVKFSLRGNCRFIMFWIYVGTSLMGQIFSMLVLIRNFRSFVRQELWAPSLFL